MKSLSKILTLFFFVYWVNATAQQTGTEQIVSKSIYKGDFTVADDKNTYTLVVFKFYALAVRRIFPSYMRIAACSRRYKTLNNKI